MQTNKLTYRRNTGVTPVTAQRSPATRGRPLRLCVALELDALLRLAPNDELDADRTVREELPARLAANGLPRGPAFRWAAFLASL